MSTVPAVETEVIAADQIGFTELGVLQGWRQIYYSNVLLGQTFGSLSLRLESAPPAFVITGDQTGEIPITSPRKHFSIVDSYDLSARTMTARGPVSPPEEGLIHALIYDRLPDVRAVFIGRHTKVAANSGRFGMLAVEPTDILEDVDHAIKGSAAEVGALALQGQTDVVISFGRSSANAGIRMLDYIRNVDRIAQKSR